MNNREQATLIWLGIALVLCLPAIRGSLWEIVKALLRPTIVVLTAALAAWTVGLCAAAHAVGVWQPDLRNDTVVWFATVGFAFFFSLDRTAEDGFFRKAASRSVQVAIFVGAFVNLAVFGLPVELGLVLVLTLVGTRVVVTEGKAEHAQVHRRANAILSLVGAILLVYVSVHVATDNDQGRALRTLALPVWLTVGTLPFVYVVGLLSAYRLAFMRIGWATDDRASRRRARRALVRVANVRAADVAGFSGHWLHDVTSADSPAAARDVMGRCRDSWRAEEHAERAANARELMREWLTDRDALRAELFGDSLRRGWGRLDRDQRAALKSEGMRLARKQTRVEVRSLPD